jgi:hypothetical protein
MSLEIKLRDATIKPYQLLQKISRRYGFELGIPENTIKEELIKSEAVVSYKGKQILKNASCSLTISDELGQPAYLYEYDGIVINDDETFREVSWGAWVFENFPDCHGVEHRFMVKRDVEGKRTAPNWFPVEND